MIEHIVRRERSGDESGIAEVLAAAFRRPESPAADPPEVALVADLRRDTAWIPNLSLVADIDGTIVGHVVCTRATIGDTAVLGLGPLAVHPDVQRHGIGMSLMNAIVVAAAVHGEAVICLVGSVAYYRRFGFVPAASLGITAPEPSWADAFQALVAAGTVVPTGQFTYAAPFATHV